jgi:hypothetical protein
MHETTDANTPDIDDEPEGDEPGPKRRSIDPMLKAVDRVFAAMDDLPDDWRSIAVTLVNRRYGG